MLDRKLLRELWRLRGQVIAVALVVMCGVAVFLTMRGMYEMLLRERDAYYAEYRFADVFAHVKRAPESEAARVADLPGVAQVDTGIQLEVTLDVPGLAEPATAQLVSVPERGRPRLNDLHLEAGRWIAPGARHEVLVSAGFARANGLQPGSSLAAVINGRWQRLAVAGIADSPEFIYVLRPASGLPDDRRYGVLWMGRDALAGAYDMDGAFNRLLVSLAPGASREQVIDELDRLLARHGSLGAYGRDEHLSHKVISDEIDQDRVYGAVVSGIFLAVAAFIIHIVLTRLVATQRDQIAILKAFGYTSGQVGLHYLKLALAIVLLGSALGLPLAAWLGGQLAAIYLEFFHFPALAWRVSPYGLAVGLAVSVSAAVAGATAALLRALRLPPAEAMRPEAPARFRPTVAERLGFQRWLGLASRMILRDLERRPWKAVFSVLGIALAVAILIAGRFGMDALEHVMDVEFRQAQRAHMTVDLANPRAAGARQDFAHLPGVLAAEPFRWVAVKLKAGHRERRTGILGLSPGGELRVPVDVDRHRVDPPPEGLLLSAKLARSLGVEVGGSVTVEVLEGARRVQQVPVSGVVDDLVGIGAYMPLGALNRLLGEDAHTLSGAYLAIDERQRDALYARLKSLPQVRGVSVRDAMLAGFREVIAKSFAAQTIANILFACVIAFGVVYNSVRIALSERAHELASLRVLGFTQREIAVMLLGEQALLTAAAIPLGFVIGYGICAAVVAALNAQETFRLPLVVQDGTYAFALLVVAAAASASGLLIWGRIRRLDLVAVLKTRE